MHGIVGYQLAQAAIVTDQVFDERMGHANTGLRRVEFTILALVQANPGVSARSLARALAVTLPNIAIWIDKLESRGLVERERSDPRRARAAHPPVAAPVPRGCKQRARSACWKANRQRWTSIQRGRTRDAGGTAAQGGAGAPQARKGAA